MDQKNIDLTGKSTEEKFELLIDLSLNYAIGILQNAEGSDPDQTGLAVATIGTLGPEPLGLADIAEAQAAGTAAAIADAKAAQSAPGRRQWPAKR